MTATPITRGNTAGVLYAEWHCACGETGPGGSLAFHAHAEKHEPPDKLAVIANRCRAAKAGSEDAHTLACDVLEIIEGGRVR